MPDTDFNGDDLYAVADVSDVEKCQGECQRDLRCGAFTYSPSQKKCWIKEGSGSKEYDKKGLISGYPGCKFQNMVGSD